MKSALTATAKSTGTTEDFLVLWKWKEALAEQGVEVTGAYGTHAGGMKRGDRQFVWATTGKELYLLGVMEVKRAGTDWNEGDSLYGRFQLIPLKTLKWKLRFISRGGADRLKRQWPLARQVRSRRRLTPETAKLLEKALEGGIRQIRQIETNIRVREGTLIKVTLSKKERSREVRVHALARRGTRCEVCGFDFAEKYGEFAKNCVEVHHLKLIASAGKRGVTTTLKDVIVVCPNCHRALHQFKNPGKWKAFQKTCHLP